MYELFLETLTYPSRTKMLEQTIVGMLEKGEEIPLPESREFICGFYEKLIEEVKEHGYFTPYAGWILCVASRYSRNEVPLSGAIEELKLHRAGIHVYAARHDAKLPGYTRIWRNAAYSLYSRSESTTIAVGAFYALKAAGVKRPRKALKALLVAQNIGVEEVDEFFEELAR